jgi:hypothetical protein
MEVIADAGHLLLKESFGEWTADFLAKSSPTCLD